MQKAKENFELAAFLNNPDVYFLLGALCDEEEKDFLKAKDYF